MKLRFRIDSVLPDRGIVFARPLDTGELKLTKHSTLGVRPVRHFDVPRQLREDGTLDLEHRARAAGAVGFISKPVDGEALRRAVARAF